MTEGCEKESEMAELLLDQMESSISSRREIAMLRIRCLNSMSSTSTDSHNRNLFHEIQQLQTPKGDGLAAVFGPMLSHATSQFLQAAKMYQVRLQDEITNESHLPTSTFHQLWERIRRLLRIYHQWVLLDPVLSEELAHQGSHLSLTQLMQFSFLSDHFHKEDTSKIIEKIEDYVQEIQDLAGTIAANSRPSFPLLSIQPFTTAFLFQRLPMKFEFRSLAVDRMPQPSVAEARTVQNEISILIHQITARQSAQVDVGFVLWPSAVVLATLLVKELCLRLDGRTSPLSLLELGAGCGLSGLVAACYYKHFTSLSVVLTDFNALVLENLRRNIDLNDLSNICTVAGLDFYQQSGTLKNHWKTMDGVLRDPVDLILAADVICQAADAIAVANTINDVLKPGGTAFVVCADAKHRFGVDGLSHECHRAGLAVSTQKVFCSDHVDDEINGSIRMSSEDRANLEQTTGYICGMSLTLFTIVKASKRGL